VELAGTGGFEPQHGGIKNRPATLIPLRIFLPTTEMEHLLQDDVMDHAGNANWASEVRNASVLVATFAPS
jgi:hypothetical protein